MERRRDPRDEAQQRLKDAALELLETTEASSFAVVLGTVDGSPMYLAVGTPEDIASLLSQAKPS
jgi:hypothetical protein